MKFRNAFFATVSSAMILASSITGAGAVTGDATVTIMQDNPEFFVTITNAGFGTLQYQLVDQYPTASLDITVTDTRGTGAGWNVTLDATDFTAGTTTPIEISNLNLLDGAQTALQSPAGDPAPLSGLTAYEALPVLKTGVSTTKVWSAAKDSGEGQYMLTMDGTLRVPAGTLVGSYLSKVTVTLNSAP